MERRKKPRQARAVKRRSPAAKGWPPQHAAEIAALEQELSIAREQQAATSEILRIISRSPTDVQPVLSGVATAARRLCDADAIVVLRDGSEVIIAAHDGPVGTEVGGRRRLDHGSVMGRAILDARTVHIRTRNELDVADFALARELADRYGLESSLAIPMLRDGAAIGVVGLRKTSAGGFTPRQIELLTTFADQAVIAIENVRLFTELQQRNAKVAEALEQQSATAEILGVISRSPTDVQPVFDTITRNAVNLCDAASSIVTTYDGESIHLSAYAGLSPEGAEALRLRFPVRPGRETGASRAIVTRSVVQIPDTREDQELILRDAADTAQYRSVLVVPMLRDGQPIGTVNVHKGEPGPFSADHVQLLQTFADQAVIAIENVRLFTELQEKNHALTKALDTQTATSEILRVISSSQTDLQPVFDTIVRSAVRLLKGYSGTMTRLTGDQIALVALTSIDAAADTIMRAAFPLSLHAAGGHATALRDRAPVNVVDAETDPRLHSGPLAPARVRGYRSVIVAPLLRQDEALGSIAVTRRESGGFTDDEIALLQTFADQAVIAIENVRLFTEVQERTHQLQVANRHKDEFLANMSHELRTPLNGIIGFSEVMLERMFGELTDKQEEYLKDILDSGRHLLSLINDILDLSKIEAGKMELEVTEFHVPTAIDNALTLIRERAARRGQVLECAIDPRVAMICGDERKVKQILLNLLSNAVKFTPEGGRITVGAGVENGHVLISITDTGIGIAPEHHALVFEEFRQVGQADKKAEGTGLGLALCRKFVELHGGRIILESQLGKGSTFSFTMPIRGRRQEL